VAEAARDVLHGDFETFTAAARRLIALGEPAVPHLGRLAGTETDPEGRLAIVLGRILDRVPAARLGPLLDSTCEPVQVAAATACGERRLEEHAPRLVDLLLDPSEDVRRAAAIALRRISNAFLGYRPEASERERAESVAEWRRLWPASR
jgi:HEAT repeat protein